MLKRFEDGSLVREVLKKCNRPLTASEISRAIARALGIPLACVRPHMAGVLRDGVHWSFLVKDKDNLYSLQETKLSDFVVDANTGTVRIRRKPRAKSQEPQHIIATIDITRSESTQQIESEKNHNGGNQSKNGECSSNATQTGRSLSRSSNELCSEKKKTTKNTDRQTSTEPSPKRPSSTPPGKTCRQKKTIKKANRGDRSRTGKRSFGRGCAKPKNCSSGKKLVQQAEV
ncbi:uncharacterized protein LOC115621371 isoform X2 [Scaptodrosophila lebanonensis]|uniref:Uncharacterized protein LOC115621371 isoform X2 n=1 Tax=Drosophila lebanonensis TaxID=7225 RepID=A0A6J2T6W6_DROLE|nr:uncharacterized protein LOC115621371 isoform X2 [Scaptodrosophila lebanonensis]